MANEKFEPRPARPGESARGPVLPDVGGGSTEGLTESHRFNRASEALNGLAAFMLAAFAVGDVRIPAYSTSGPKTEMPIKVEGRDEQAIDQRRVAEVVARLREHATLLQDPEVRQKSELFREGVEIGRRCRFTSDWFLKEAHNLDAVWDYLVAHKQRWPQSVNDSFDAIHKEIASFPWIKRKAAKMPSNQVELERQVSEKFDTPKAFKCGFALNFVTKNDEQKAQRIGILLIDAIANFVLSDLEKGNPVGQKEALQAAEAMSEALKSITKG